MDVWTLPFEAFRNASEVWEPACDSNEVLDTTPEVWDATSKAPGAYDSMLEQQSGSSKPSEVLKTTP